MFSVQRLVFNTYASFFSYFYFLLFFVLALFCVLLSWLCCVLIRATSFGIASSVQAHEEAARPGAGCRVQGAGCRVQGAGCRMQSAGCRVGFGLTSGAQAHEETASPHALLQRVRVCDCSLCEIRRAAFGFTGQGLFRYISFLNIIIFSPHLSFILFICLPFSPQKQISINFIDVKYDFEMHRVRGLVSGRFSG